MAKKRSNARHTTNTAANRAQSAAVKSSPAKSSSTNGNGSASRTVAPSGKAGTNGTTTRSNGTNGSSVTSTRLAEARARNAAQRAQARRRAASGTFWRRNWPIITTVVSVVVLIAIFVVLANRPSSTAGIGDPAPSTLVKQVTGVSDTVIDKVAAGSNQTSLQVPQGATAFKDSDGKPIFLYVGADYCPFCAAERWSMIVALSRFGTFKDLHLMKSSVSDGNISTFTFHGSSYTSEYLTFQPVEIQDRDGNTLQTLTTEQQAIFDKYDAAPYSNSTGGIPFISIANKFIQTNAGYQSTVISDLSWQQIGDKLSDPNDDVTKAIVGEANYLTAAICQTTNQQPAPVCTSATIQQIAKQLPKGS